MSLRKKLERRPKPSPQFNKTMPINLRSCLEILCLLEQAENAVARLYAGYAKRWPQHADFWDKLVRREQQHGQFIAMLASLVETRPDDFREGRQFTAAAINTFIAGVTRSAEQTPKLTAKQAFFTAQDIERSVLKRNFYSVVETDNPELNGFIKKVADEAAELSRTINAELQTYSEKIAPTAETAPPAIADITPYINTLDAMEQVELAMAAFYRACAERWPDHADFLTEIALEEERHADYVRQIRALAAAHPGEMRPGKPLNAEAARTFAASITDYAQQISKGYIDFQHALAIARELETSVFEKEFFLLLNSDNVDFYNLIKTISKDLSTHTTLIDAYAKLNKRGD